MASRDEELRLHMLDQDVSALGRDGMTPDDDDDDADGQSVDPTRQKPKTYLEVSSVLPGDLVCGLACVFVLSQ